jgi:hypothetical protein
MSLCPIVPIHMKDMQFLFVSEPTNLATRQLWGHAADISFVLRLEEGAFVTALLPPSVINSSSFFLCSGTCVWKIISFTCFHILIV